MAISPDTHQQKRNLHMSRNHNGHYHNSDASSVSSDSSLDGSRNNSAGNTKNQNSRKRRPRNRTRKQQKKVTLSQEELNTYVAVDCEMVGVGPDGRESALARVTMIDWHGNVIMDAFVKPSKPVTDYRTFVSGITPADLENANAMDFETCRINVLQILEGRILIGHALKNDLNALGIHHPWFMIRDSAKYEPYMKVHGQSGLPCARKLKDLTSEQLHREIQLAGQAHCPYEDALAAMDLYKHARVQWEAVIEYKVSKTRQMVEAQRQEVAAQ